MESRSNVIAAGIFVILLTVGLVATSLYLTRDRLDLVQYRVYSSIPVTGLHPKAAVRLRGVDVGRVDTIAFDPTSYKGVQVTISVDRTAPITQGTFGQLAYQGVTGLSYIALDDDGSNPKPLAPDSASAPPIELRASVLDQITASSQDLIKGAVLVTARINTLLSTENVASLGATLHNAQAATAQLAGLAGELRPAARSLQGLASDAHKTFGQLDLLVGDLRGVSTELGKHLGALDAVGRSAESVGEASRTLQTALIGDTLPRLSVAIDDLARTSRTLDSVLLDVDQHPRELLFGRGPPPPGPGEPGFAAPGGSR
jgi:phospholipid/cholesterol/gamma-HCH transport system substrate-binding protein